MNAPKKKNKKLDLVKSKSSLRKTEKFNEVYEELRQIVNDMGNVDEHIDDPAFIQKICELIENVTSIKLAGKEKLDLALKLILSKFPVLNNENDIKRITKQIAHMVESGIIEKVSDAKVATVSLCNFLAKKLL